MNPETKNRAATPPGSPALPTRAAQDFAVSFNDARRLFALYDAENSRSTPQDAEVLKRAALILAVTAFETYIEDFLREKFPPRILAATGPGDFHQVFEIVAKRWLREHQDKPGSLAQWTGCGWKRNIELNFEQRIASLNSPKADVIIGLFRHFLGEELSKHWQWPGYGFEPACERLDAIVSLRGRVSHVARKLGEKPAKHDISRPDLKKYLSFLECLVAATDKIK